MYLTYSNIVGHYFIRGGHMQTIVPVDIIERKILLIRGQKVILDRDFVDLDGIAT